mgnify:CR=1 FL=1
MGEGTFIGTAGCLSMAQKSASMSINYVYSTQKLIMINLELHAPRSIISIHLFVALLVHLLLKHADVGTTVFISMPYFIDRQFWMSFAIFLMAKRKEEGAWCGDQYYPK